MSAMRTDTRDVTEQLYHLCRDQRAMMRWCQYSANGCCPVCGESRYDGHAEQCEYAAILAVRPEHLMARRLM